MWTSIVADLFGRTQETLHEQLAGLSADELLWRPDPDANPVGWLAWHALRVQDDHLAHLAGRGQVWHDGWRDRFDLPYPADAIGYGHSSAEVGAFAATAELLLGYADAVHERTLEVLHQLAEDDLDRVVDTSWDPPVTLAVRLVSVVNDVTQHVGQVGYVLGLAARRPSGAGERRTTD